jgi:hypothetical protein
MLEDFFLKKSYKSSDDKKILFFKEPKLYRRFQKSLSCSIYWISRIQANLFKDNFNVVPLITLSTPKVFLFVFLTQILIQLV